MTVGDAIKYAYRYLASENIESAQREGEILLGEVLNISPVELYINLKQGLTAEEYKKFNEYLLMRKNGLPISYITGYSYFMGLKFKVSSATLIPRQETEILVEECLNFIVGKENASVLEIGTGCGNIAVALAKFSGVRVVSVESEKNQPAIEVAEKNALYHQVKEKITFISGNMFDAIERDCHGRQGRPRNDKFDCLISNPPYVRESEYSELPQEVKKEPPIALKAGEDGLKYIKIILREAHRYIKKGGRIFMEIGYSQREEVADIASKIDSILNFEFIKDLSGIDRVFVGYL